MPLMNEHKVCALCCQDLVEPTSESHIVPQSVGGRQYILVHTKCEYESRDRGPSEFMKYFNFIFSPENMPCMMDGIRCFYKRQDGISLQVRRENHPNNIQKLAEKFRHSQFDRINLQYRANASMDDVLMSVDRSVSLCLFPNPYYILHRHVTLTNLPISGDIIEKEETLTFNWKLKNCPIRAIWTVYIKRL